MRSIYSGLLFLLACHLALVQRFSAQPGNIPWLNLGGDCDQDVVNQKAEDLPAHKVKVLESCVVNYLREEFRKANDDQQLNDNPPLKTINDKLEIAFDQMVISDYKVTDESKSVVISGYLAMRWQDFRINWELNKFRIGNVRVESSSNIWTPDLQVDDAMGSAGAVLYFGDLNVTYQGAVSAKAEFTLNEDKNCVFNLEDYPNDEVTCCNSFVSKAFGPHLTYNVIKAQGEMRRTWKPTYWKITDISMNELDDNPMQHKLTICATAKRDSKNLRIELTVPMAIAAIVLLAAPLFPSLKGQLYVKLFTLLLQFLCFQFLIENTPQISLGSKVPRIHRFYEFTLGMTLFSLVCSLVVMCLMHCKSRIPPSHGISLASAAINNVLCCVKPPSHDEPPVPGSQQGVENGAAAAATVTPSADKTPHEWANVWVALNNLLALIVIVVYILGLIIINA